MMATMMAMMTETLQAKMIPFNTSFGHHIRHFHRPETPFEIDTDRLPWINCHMKEVVVTGQNTSTQQNVLQRDLSASPHALQLNACTAQAMSS